MNVGDTPTDGSAAVDISLPPGISGVSVEGLISGAAPVFWTCSDPAGASAVHCDASAPLPVAPGRLHPEVLTLTAVVDPAASGSLSASMELSGGGASGPSAIVATVTPSATPDFNIQAFDGGTFQQDGSASTQAGGHPDSAMAAFALGTTLKSKYLVVDGGDLRNVRVDLPPGLVGNPTAVPVCPRGLRIPSQNQASLGDFDPNSFCSVTSIVGTAEVRTMFAGGQVERYVAPVFSLDPAPGEAAQFGFSVADQTTYLSARVRTDGDYGVTVVTRNALQLKTVLGSRVTLWGVPSDPSHDEQRCMVFFNAFGGAETSAFPEDGPLPTCGETNHPPNDTAKPWLMPHSANLPPRAFMTNPTACTPPGVGLKTRLHIESWNPVAGTDDASFMSHLPPGLPLPMDQWGAEQGPTACEKLPFEPSLAVAPDTAVPDAPSGLSFDLSFPTDGLTNPSGLSQAHLKRALVRLPEGMSISPSAADGLAACSDPQSSVGTLNRSACPEASKIGTVEATTPLLDEVLKGGVYIGSQKSSDPASGEMFRLFLTLDSEERGIHVKLPGQVRVDPATGRIETIFDNNPQVPVEKLSLRLKSGARAPLAMPAACGTKTIEAVFESWAGQTATRSDSFAVDCPGQTGFSPGFEAGSISPTGGAFSPFVARITRPDRQQFLSGVRVDMPKGLVAKLKGVPLCDDMPAANGGCPAGSRIGTATVAAGPGSNPFYLQGPVYLTEGYRGGPYGLSVQVDVKAGPFDLGLVVVRQAIYVDPRTAELTVISDPLPQIVKGVPVRLRSATVAVDREDFTINPTSCAVKQVRATLTSIDGAVHDTATRFQAGDCASLGFKPRLKMRFTGTKQRRTGDHPGLRTTVTQSTGQANIHAAQVTLPRSIALDPANSTDPALVCDYDKALEADCPTSSVIGRASAKTPLLNRPLVGDVHLVQGIRFGPRGNRIRTTPGLLVKLRGEVAIDLRAKTTAKAGRLVTTFGEVPDAQVARFSLNLRGGERKGILVVTRTRRAKIDICRSKQTASVKTDGQNGRHANYATPIRVPCAKNGAKRRTG